MIELTTLLDATAALSEDELTQRANDIARRVARDL
jgi:hypothetical protein